MLACRAPFSLLAVFAHTGLLDLFLPPGGRGSEVEQWRILKSGRKAPAIFASEMVLPDDVGSVLSFLRLYMDFMAAQLEGARKALRKKSCIARRPSNGCGRELCMPAYSILLCMQYSGWLSSRYYMLYGQQAAR